MRSEEEEDVGREGRGADVEGNPYPDIGEEEEQVDRRSRISFEDEDEDEGCSGSGGYGRSRIS